MINQKLEIRNWKLEIRNQELEIRNQDKETVNQKLEIRKCTACNTGNQKLEIRNIHRKLEITNQKLEHVMNPKRGDEIQAW